MFFSKRYRLNHCRDVLQKTTVLFHQKKRELHTADQEEIKNGLMQLQIAIENNDKTQADEKARIVESLRDRHLHPPRHHRILESILALAVALFFAVLIRQSWFELYEIPTGSMRPTFKEQDHLTVSKTQFGINTPLSTSHLYFNPDLVERSGTIIFSGEGLPLLDTSSTFLGVFPYTKRYVKRLIGKPGDQLTFYGGKIYGLDKEGLSINSLQDSPWMEKLEHIPFLGFEGQPMRSKPQEILLTYFYLPLGKISLQPDGNLKGEVFNGTEWVADSLAAVKSPHDKVKTLSDLFGMRNFAMTQLYAKEEVEQDSELKKLAKDDSPFFLVFRHTPHLDFTGSKSREFPLTLKTVLPLDAPELQAIQNNLYTARFIVENERAKKYSIDSSRTAQGNILLPGVPDGTYEFYHGIAYEVLWGGITQQLDKDHPLYATRLLPTLYNAGIQWDRSYLPLGKQYPYRYSYFRDGALYLMGASFLEQASPKLQRFVENEKKRQEAETRYAGFIDSGAPQPTASSLKAFGITLPESHYLVLGDNHAMSGDSRVFGFVPEDNLQGVPEWIFWPPGDRFGRPDQPSYSLFVFPRLMIWALAACGAIGYYLIRRHRLRKHVKID